MSTGQRGWVAGLIELAMVAQMQAQTAQPAQITIDESKITGTLDLSRYSLGQGGISSDPIFRAQIPELQQLHPRTVRFFIQEYYNLYPDHNTYHWTTLDSTLDDIVALGAEPIPAIVIKPRVLYPAINPGVIYPNNWTEWETLIEHLVLHCKDKGYGIRYWELGNEGEAGEAGGCPYAWQPAEYVEWYRHTAAAVRRADPNAKVGGPALGSFASNHPVGKELIRQAGAGNVPLDFYSWHAYGSFIDLKKSIDSAKSLLAEYPSLSQVETMITEWNSSFNETGANPMYIPVFVLEETRAFLSNGLSAAAFYHIKDYIVDQSEFAAFLTPGGAAFMADYWNTQNPYLGMYSNKGVMRPVYYTFLWLSQIHGPRVQTTSSAGEIQIWAVKNGSTIKALLWNWGWGWGPTYDATISFPSTTSGSFTLKKLNSFAVTTETIRSGSIADLASTPLHATMADYDVLFLEVNSGPDVTPPSLVSAGSAGLRRVQVNFTESLNDATANNPANYSINKLSISSASIDVGDRRSVSLEVSPMVNGQTYTLSVSNVKDIAGNSISAASSVEFVASDRITVLTDQIPSKEASDGRAYELGMKFTTSQAGNITAIRYYKTSNESGSHTGRIWSSSGALLASVGFGNESVSGWQEAQLSAALGISSGAVYVVSVNCNTHYAATNDGLSVPVANGPLSSVADGANGVFGDPGVFPIQTWQNTNYFRDVVFIASSLMSAGRNSLRAPAMSRAVMIFDLRGRRLEPKHTAPALTALQPKKGVFIAVEKDSDARFPGKVRILPW